MGTTTFSGPVRAGTVREGATANVGSAMLVQSVSLPWKASSLTSDAIFYLPAGAAIVDVWAEPTVVFNSTGASTLSFGITSGGTEYGGSLDVKTAGVKRATSTAAIAAAKANITTNTALYATVTSADQPSAGAVQVFVQYIQK